MKERKCFECTFSKVVGSGRCSMGVYAHDLVLDINR